MQTKHQLALVIGILCYCDVKSIVPYVHTHYKIKVSIQTASDPREGEACHGYEWWRMTSTR